MLNEKVLFIDRDGTIISEPSDFQVDSISKLDFEPYVIIALKNLKNFGYKLIMITNQDYLGTNKFPKKNFYKPHNLIIKILYSQGIIFDEILICPHSIKENCLCRKPKTNLIKNWLIKGALDKKNSYVIGDRDTDMKLAKNIGINGLKYNKNKLSWKKINNQLTQVNRFAIINRKTQETNINIKIWLDKIKTSRINTGINFFNHMIHQICIHSGITLDINVKKNDLYIDDHHTIEDTGLALGNVIFKSLGKKIGISRFGFVLPMDDCLSHCIMDVSNRPYFNYKVKFNYQYVGDMSTEMIEHFFRSIACTMSINLYIKSKGNNDHHKAESIFKAFGRTLKQVIKIENNVLPSSKGLL